MTRTAALLVLGSLLWQGPSRAQAQIIYVNPDAAGLDDGSSWDNAFPELRDALPAAPPMGEVWVRAGTYTPVDCPIQPCDRGTSFVIPDGLRVYGGFDGSEVAEGQRDPAANVTVLSGDLLGNDAGGMINIEENSVHIVAGPNTGPGTILDGFEIRGGNADGALLDGVGGGLFAEMGNLQVRNCRFIENTAAVAGGAVYVSAGAAPSFSDCHFEANASGQGAALANLTADPTLRGCSFLANAAIGNGGAIFSDSANLTAIACQFDQNMALRGGAIYHTAAGQTALWNCRFDTNTASQLGGAFHGSSVGLVMTNCLLSDNRALGGGGGAVYGQDLFVGQFTNCTLAFNNAAAGAGGGLLLDNSPVEVVNSILWGNFDSGIDAEMGQLTSVGPPAMVNFSILEGGWTGPGGNNVNADPDFVSIPGDDFGVMPGSAAIDAGDTLQVPADSVDVDGNGDFGELVPTDLIGNPRIVDDPATPDSGVSLPKGTVDIGAHELVPGPQLTRLYVDQAAPGGAGSDWANAFNNPLDAMIAAEMSPAVTEIWVAAGLYTPAQPAGPRNVSFFLVDGVAIYGGFSGGEMFLDERDPQVNVTVLSGDLNGDDGPDFANVADNSFHVLTSLGQNGSALLDGFTLRGGNADGAFPNANGGGALIENGAPTLVRLRFESNRAIDGGGALHLDMATPVVLLSEFRGNFANNSGGAVQLTNGSNPAFIGSLFHDNQASANGGAVRVNASFVFMSQCTLGANVASAGLGGGVFFDALGAVGQIQNSILWGNTAGGAGGEAAQLTVVNGTVNVNYTTVEGGWSGGGIGNIASDPQFTDLAGGDLHQAPGSPANDAADTTALPADDFDVDGNGDISEPLPIDLDRNPRIVEDLAAPNTGVPVINPGPIVDQGCYESASGPPQDCNGNGVADDEDILMGTSQDCNLNGVPDECELAECPPDNPDCDDCNLNGVIDVCDILDRSSMDGDGNGVPDECVDFTGGCGPDAPEWTCIPNWNLKGAFPNNNGQTYSVTLDDMDLCFLDEDITIDTLRILDDGVLQVTQAGQGDFGIVSAGGLLIEGQLQVARDRVIAVNGPVLLRQGTSFQTPARYKAADDIVKPAQATLLADSVRVEPGGGVELRDDMTVQVSGDYVLDGSTIDLCPTCGGKLPPITDNPDNGAILVEGDLQFSGTVDWNYASSAILDLRGSFDNQCTWPPLFQFSVGGLGLYGDDEQHFEVGGEDLGNSLDGFNNPDDDGTSGDVGPHTNFSMGTIDVQNGASTLDAVFENTFENLPENQGGSGPCEEVLYVRTLILRSGAIMRIDNTKIYYETFIDEGGTVDIMGPCSALTELPSCLDDGDCDSGSPCFAASCDAGTCTFMESLAGCADTADGDGIRDDGCLWWSCSRDTCSSIAIVYADYGTTNGSCQPDLVADANDRFHALNCFSNTTTTGTTGYPCELSPPGAYNVDAAGIDAPCSPDGVCDANDAFAALNAFEASTTCSCAGPEPQALSRPRPAQPASLLVAVREDRVAAGQTIEVDFFVREALPDLRGYQLHIDISGGTRGRLDISDLFIIERRDQVFARQPAWSAFNQNSAQFIAGLDKPGIATAAGAYLGSATLQASRGASGTFHIDLSIGPKGRTKLFASRAQDRIAIQGVQSATVTIESSHSTRR